MIRNQIFDTEMFGSVSSLSSRLMTTVLEILPSNRIEPHGEHTSTPGIPSQLACPMATCTHAFLSFHFRVDQLYWEGTATTNAGLHTHVQSADLPLVGREEADQPEPPQ
jgi:hypothetical protein